ncbi:hypothetical protein [Nocardia mangyaensis]|uniref:hypothetical protein n=1 Tax=Nocardia mangyaensis TaxID=2213200 RepID=UPI002676640B|nr:hypothetical protein [Nocardia mangyaensis]MDO3649925.1 hypothetical protein [Nocardia mangyaensis]
MNARSVPVGGLGLFAGLVVGCYLAHAGAGSWVETTWTGQPVATAVVESAVVAVVVLAVLARGNPRYPVAAGAGLVGVALLGAVSAMGSPGTFREQAILMSLGVGLLGAAAVLRPAGQAWFAVGAIVAVVFGARLDNLLLRIGFMSFEASAQGAADVTVTWLLLLVTTVGLVVSAWLLRSERVGNEMSRRGVALGVGLPLGAGVLLAVTDSVVVTVALLVIVLAVVCVRVSGPAAVGVATVLAVAAAVAADPTTVFETDARWLSLQVVLLAAGAVAGMRWPRPTLGVGLLAVVTVTGILPELIDTLVVTEAAYLVVFPAAVGFALGSCLPAPLPTVMTAAVLPAFGLLLAYDGWFVPEPEPVSARPDSYVMWIEGVVVSEWVDPAGSADLTAEIMSDGRSGSGWPVLVEDVFTAAPHRVGPTIAATALILGCAVIAAWRRTRADRTD